MCKKRKEKKLNMQGKDNMVLNYFIINIHMQLRRRGGWLQYFQFLEPTKEFTHKKRGSCTWARDPWVLRFHPNIYIHIHALTFWERKTQPQGKEFLWTHALEDEKGKALWRLLNWFIKSIHARTHIRWRRRGINCLVHPLILFIMTVIILFENMSG